MKFLIVGFLFLVLSGVLIFDSISKLQCSDSSIASTELSIASYYECAQMKGCVIDVEDISNNKIREARLEECKLTK